MTAPSAADLAATVREAISYDGYVEAATEQELAWRSVLDAALAALDALLARCQEAEREVSRLTDPFVARDQLPAAFELMKARAEVAEAELAEARRIALSLADQLTDAVDRRAAAEARVAELEQALTRWRASLSSASPAWGWIVREIDAALQSGGTTEGETDE